MPFNGGWTTVPAAMGFKLFGNETYKLINLNSFVSTCGINLTYIGAGKAGGSDGIGGG